MKIVISSGHSKHVSGAVGVLNEVAEARKVVEQVAKDLRAAGAEAVVFHDDTSTNVSANIGAITKFHNSQARDLDVSVHFNAFQKTDAPRGTEVLYVTQDALAKKVSAAIAKAGGFIDRGAKKRTDLGFLNGTQKPAILIEVCFVDSTADAKLYQANFSVICKAIAEAVSGLSMAPAPPAPVPPSDAAPVLTMILASDKPVNLTISAGPNVTLVSA